MPLGNGQLEACVHRTAQQVEDLSGHVETALRALWSESDEQDRRLRAVENRASVVETRQEAAGIAGTSKARTAAKGARYAGVGGGGALLFWVLDRVFPVVMKWLNQLQSGP
ncbi:MAG: hypothetical protein KAW17_09675 [Candidatus Eisenbacteria sp.]|nr:hypothetical protein [Candidatus Eisenbacteria bacterium]